MESQNNSSWKNCQGLSHSNILHKTWSTLVDHVTLARQVLKTFNNRDWPTSWQPAPQLDCPHGAIFPFSWFKHICFHACCLLSSHYAPLQGAWLKLFNDLLTGQGPQPHDFVVLSCWIHSSSLRSCFDQYKTGHCSRYDPMIPEWGRVVFSLCLLAVLLPAQPRIYLGVLVNKAHCCLMSHLLLTVLQILFFKATSQPINFQTIYLWGILLS